jgi:selenide, water dikinase
VDAPLASRDLVLVGAGHTHAHVLRMWRMRPIADVRLTIVSPFSVATYSGMLPGTLAGLYQPHEMEIDLVRLTASCGARLIVAKAIGLDPRRCELFLEDRPPIVYDVASIGIGSVPARGDVWRSNPDVLSIKPMQTFRERLDARLAAVRERHGDRPPRIAVVGAGAAGTEVSFCLEAGLRRRRLDAELLLFDSGETLLEGYADSTRQRATRELERRGIEVQSRSRVVGFDVGQLSIEAGDAIDVDLVIWAVGAAPPAVLDRFDLPRGEDGFLAVDATLRTTAGHDVFVVGDTASIVGHPLPRAGVHAVREGPTLWHNLQRTFAGRPLREHRPQSGFLSLLALGDGRAIGEWKGWSFEGRIAWWIKDRIDRAFVEKHRDFRPMQMPVAAAPTKSNDPPRMRCRGCGGKVGAGVLDEALWRAGGVSPLLTSTRPRILDHSFDDSAHEAAKQNEGPRQQGARAPRSPVDREDAAILTGDARTVDLVSIDVFQAFADDPYLVGRVAALNSLSDLWAMGGRATGALAIVTLPEGRRSKQVELLFQLLAGALREFGRISVPLLGGHTREGDEWAIGFTVLGQLDGQPPFANAALRPGDQLVLTKPLGSGTLLAAHALAACPARSYDALLATLLAPNDSAASIARRHGVVAATDVTGFGLAGHLFEMLDASGLSARLSLKAIPRLRGFDALSLAGIRSSLDEANREIADRIDARPERRGEPAFHALFDPQTSGGLLLAIPAAAVEALQHDLVQGGLMAAVVGEVVPKERDEPRIVVVDGSEDSPRNTRSTRK